MGFWGKTIGIGFGFMLGGPLGAIIGGAIGHMYDVDKKTQNGGAGWRCPQCGNSISAREAQAGRCPQCGAEFGSTLLTGSYDRQFIFYVSLAALAAKMAKADGVVTEDEILAFDHFVRIELGLNVEERKIVARLFNEAKNSGDDGLAVAQQFRNLIGYQPDVLQTMVHLLFRIAMADGHYHPAEERFIHQTADIFGLTAQEYGQIRALFIKNNDRAYQILGVSQQASDEEIKSAYKKLVLEYHPDKLMSKGVPEDFIKIANEKMAKINSAYDQIRKERNL